MATKPKDATEKKTARKATTAKKLSNLAKDLTVIEAAIFEKQLINAIPQTDADSNPFKSEIESIYNKITKHLS